MEEEHVQNQSCDGALFILRGESPTRGAGPWFRRSSSEWKREAVILNNPGRKYTIGSGQNWDSFDPEKHGQFLVFRNKADVAHEHCQIECDANGTFWLHSFGFGNIFLNGKLIQDYPVELKFGDLFYFSPIFSQFWDSLLIPIVKTKDLRRLLYRKNQSGKEYAVFLFTRLPLDVRIRLDLDNESDPGSDNQSLSTNLSIFENHVILTKIFEHVVNTKIPSDQGDLFNCRLVSKSWNDSARLVLQKNFVMKFGIIMNTLIFDPNHFTNRFYWHIHSMKGLKFDAMNIDIWQMEGFWARTYALDQEDAITKLSQDLSAFINQPDFHPLKILTISGHCSTPISILLSKFCNSLEEIDINVNRDWITDEKPISKYGLPEDLRFPNLKKLTLKLYELERYDAKKISNSKFLAKVIQGSTGIEELVLQNYSKLPIQFDSFTNLRKISIFAWRLQSNLHDLLTAQLMTLPAGQLRFFKLIVRFVVVESTPEVTLLSLLQKQRQSLENLELSLEQVDLVNLPRCMPNLKTLWITSDADRTKRWRPMCGFKLGSQLAKEGANFTAAFDSEMLERPLIVREGGKCGREECRTCNDSFVYGEWRRNVEK